MTLAELVAEIKFEGQIENDTDWSNHIYRFISDEAAKLAIETRDEALLVSQHSLALADQDATSKLIRVPTNFLVAYELRFRTATSVEWILPSRTGIVPPPLTTGKPKAYDFYGSESISSQAYKSSIRLLPDPYTMISREKVLLTYLRQPFEEITPATTSTTVIFPFRWLGDLKKRVVARIHTYHIANRGERAGMLEKSVERTAPAIPQDNPNPIPYASPRNA